MVVVLVTICAIITTVEQIFTEELFPPRFDTLAYYIDL